MSVHGLDDAIRRMKIEPIIQLTSQTFDFIPFETCDSEPAAVLINNFFSLPYDEKDFARLRSWIGRAVIMMFVPDFSPFRAKLCRAWSEFIDVFIVPTPEMRDLMSAYTDKTIRCLHDPIDFSLSETLIRRHQANARPKLVWFGYPDSYLKSMRPYEDMLARMHHAGEIEFAIITQKSSFKNPYGFEVIDYSTKTFLGELEACDICVLSHAPFDFSMSTYWKSENKAILAINRGLPTIASRTPSYQRLFQKCDLEPYLFSSNAELARNIRALYDANARNRFLEKSQQHVLETYSCRRMVDLWLDMLTEARTSKTLEPGTPPLSPCRLPQPMQSRRFWSKPLAELLLTLARLFRTKKLAAMSLWFWEF